MRKITFYGHSDDNIRFTGPRLDDEIGAFGGLTFGFDDGTVIKAVWRDTHECPWAFEALAVGEGSTLEKVPTPENGNSEHWTLEGNFTCFFRLDWQPGNIQPSPTHLRAALATATRVLFHAETTGSPPMLEVQPGNRTLWLEQKYLFMLLLRAAGATAPIGLSGFGQQDLE